MKEQKYWDAYKVISSQLASELPAVAAPFGELVIKWSPLLMLIILLSMLMDRLFKSSTIKFLSKGFVNLCQLAWKDAFKEPVNQGLIIEAPKRVQIVFYKFCAWIFGILGFVLICYGLFVFAALLYLGLRNSSPIENTVLLIVLSGISVLLGYLQIGYCHQSIKLVKQLKSSN